MQNVTDPPRRPSNVRPSLIGADARPAPENSANAEAGPSRVLASLEGKKNTKPRTAAITSALLVILIAGVSYGAWRASKSEVHETTQVARADAPAEPAPPAAPVARVPPEQAARIIDAPAPAPIAPLPGAANSPLAALEHPSPPRAAESSASSARATPSTSPLASLADTPEAKPALVKSTRVAAAPAAKPRRPAPKPAAPAKATTPPHDPDADLLAALLQRRIPPRPATPDN